ncbi:putative ATP-dependent RNA helicase DHX34 isoform X2 [Temnothorax americanus]|uniref:putative ATP-dependent RNA helicase DHX34 isoform X2 n=1 Tax=Temnothorax americanus TaxID=1964332 RepID=UPI0040687BAC
MSSRNWSGMKGRSSSGERRREDDGRYVKKHLDDHKSDKRGSSTSTSSTRSARARARSGRARETHELFPHARTSETSSSEAKDRDRVPPLDGLDEAEDMYFSKCKRELNKIFIATPNLVHDVVDFWKFVEKYESVTVEKRVGDGDDDAVADFARNRNAIGLPEKYRKSHCLNLKLALSYGDAFAGIPETNASLTDARLLKFRDVILLYLDFEQKEKFAKLKRLRDAQANLPVARYKEDIIEMVKMEKVIIVAGDTGCGKSTQIPRYLYEAGFRKIACAQPRRIACVSLAKRVAFETLSENLSRVGYQIRFEKQRNRETNVTFITEGLLLRQVSDESTLSAYDAIVLDEVHERHLHGDLLLGIMKCIVNQKPDLKLVLMSATINIQLFSNYFAKENVKIIEVPGRLYPIQLFYRPVTVEDLGYKNDRFNPSPYVQIMQIIDQKYPVDEKGDLLIFLSGISEITAVVDAAKEYSIKKNNWIVLPLHSTLSIVEQDKVFDYAPDGVRKCIVATNIAETSITIDGIRFVADSGKVKEMSYDPSCKMQRLKEFWISKASAEQRKGRAGRTGPGVCYRIYSEEEYKTLEKYSTPELQRVPLDSSLLQMIAMGLPDARKFPFIEPPPADSLENAILSLKDHVEPVLSVAAALSVQTPFTNRAYRDTECETSRKKLESDHGDPITLLNAFKEWLEVKRETSQEYRSSTNSSRKWCGRRGLEEQRFYEMTKLRAQFKDLLQDCTLLKSLPEPTSSMTSAERAIRHGELKFLKSLKRTYKQSEPKRRKQLKVETFDVHVEDNEEDNGELDIKDIEFRMRNDSSQVRNLLTASTACSYKDLTMLKLILCSGLYPQFACADEFNYCKSISEQLFHTKAKPYVALHPMSFFGNHPQVLQIDEADITPMPGFKSKTPVSSKHQILAYLSLLETTKPYLVNTLRMPAAQTLLLFAHEIDTNSTFSIIACDSWLMLEFPVPDSGQVLLLKAAKLRNKWDFLLNQQLQGSDSADDERKDFSKVEQSLTHDVIEYMHTTIPYTIRRLLPADLKIMYVGNGNNDTSIEPNPFHADFKSIPNIRKGGAYVTDSITYNCIKESTWSEQLRVEMQETEWHCETCDLRARLASIEKLQHQNSCAIADTISVDKKSENIIRKANSQAYECPDCSLTLYFTPIEILKHKKLHIKAS